MKNYLESKPRYEVLDGLRGVAAIVVVLYHLLESYPTGLLKTYISHGYLAVDFFFALSGFVIGYAYDDRWDRMTLKSFFKRRIVRLHPMVIFGAIVGVCFFYYTGDFELFGKVDDAIWWMVLLQTALMMLMIPLPPSMDIRGWGELTSINGPVWTLMFEYVANIFYALVLRHLPKLALGILAACAALLTADVTLRLNIFGLLESDWNSYSLVGGFIFNPEHVYIGYVRLLYPFLSGLLISRIGKKFHIPNGFWITSLILFASLNVPVLGGETKIIDGAYQLICVLIIFPIVLMLGAGSTIKGKKSTAICKFLGDISFPLYITHYPLIYLQMDWVAQHPDAPLWQHVSVGAGVVFMAIIIAWGLLKAYDLPVREWLKEHWLKR
jgi:peptidoglycan/LPS O-acetylase OafA/YrhL